MKTPIEVVKELGAPTHSYLAAVRFFNEEYGTMSQEHHERGYASILGLEKPIQFETHQLAKFHFLYAIQETVRIALTGTPIAKEVKREVNKRVKKLESTQPELFKDFAENLDDNGERKVDAVGKPKQKKGAKAKRAREVFFAKIQGKNLKRSEAMIILMEEVPMSKGGASTYYNDLKNKLGI